jgi:hypothetical protein
MKDLDSEGVLDSKGFLDSKRVLDSKGVLDSKRGTGRTTPKRSKNRVREKKRAHSGRPLTLLNCRCTSANGQRSDALLAWRVRAKARP